jgi:hypothetical protein
LTPTDSAEEPKKKTRSPENKQAKTGADRRKLSVADKACFLGKHRALIENAESISPAASAPTYLEC